MSPAIAISNSAHANTDPMTLLSGDIGDGRIKILPNTGNDAYVCLRSDFLCAGDASAAPLC